MEAVDDGGEHRRGYSPKKEIKNPTNKKLSRNKFLIDYRYMVFHVFLGIN